MTARTPFPSPAQATADRLRSLTGCKVVAGGILDGKPYFTVQHGAALWDVVVQSDPEGNGPGAVEVVPLNGDASDMTTRRGLVSLPGGE